MKRFFTILALSLSFFSNANAQTVVVNPDGTHSTVINNGNLSTVVNSDGTHSTVINNGNTSTIVNPNGTHSTVINNGNISTIVNSNGTHSTVFNNGNISTIVHPNGSHSVIIKNDVTVPFVNTIKTDSTQNIIADTTTATKPLFSKKKKSREKK